MKLIAQPLGGLTPSPRISGEIRVPGDKSISHRSIMFGSLANGTTEVSGFLEGADALATLDAFRSMGVEISDPKNGSLQIQGVGVHGLSQPSRSLDMGNSGTSMRLLSGLLAGQSFPTTLIGDESLSRRPMGRVAKPLSSMGADIQTASDGCPPVEIFPAKKLTGIEYTLPMASAQVKSALLLAGIYAEGSTSVIEPAVTRDHTERMLQGFGYAVNVSGSRVTLEGGGQLQSTAIDVPGDISSAAFFMVAASIAKNAELCLRHVGINATRTGVIDILKLMGADITIENKRQIGGEAIADIVVRSADLKGIAIPEDLVPLAIDEFPALFVAAAFAEGVTTLTGAEELRVKESDRIQAMVDGLQLLGINAVGTEDGAIINGSPTDASKLGRVAIECHHDHRIAMAFAVASLRSQTTIEIDRCENIVTSFPNFVELANQVGFQLQQA